MITSLPHANQSWFTFSVTTSAGCFSYSVYEFLGRERINDPFEFSIEFVASGSSLPTFTFLGKEGLLAISDKSGGVRFIHGYIREMHQLHSGNKFTHYRCILVPRFWFLRETLEHKIFQNKAVPQIIKEVLQNKLFVSESYSFKLNGEYKKREYCVQYGESDLDFISRLCEEEGIAFIFTHSKSGHCLTFYDTPGGEPIPGACNLRFEPGTGNVADTAVIARLNHLQRINSDSASYQEWNFQKPSLNLAVNKLEPDWKKAPAPQGMKMDSYRFPHLYQLKEDGERYAELQLLRQLTYREWIEGSGDVARLIPGHIFTVNSHPRPDLNRSWWITEVSQRGEQPGVLLDEAPERGMQYHASFAAIPDDTRFVPELVHKKIRIEGIQSAIVTGPEGEEIYVDEFGRVKVQFHWDRVGEWDETTSCWIRVSQGWAGGEYGTIAIPRIGHEVIVSFMEGDPDRPLITGRAYHAVNKMPYDLPDNKTRTVFKSFSSLGGNGFNELRIEDKKNEEEIFVRAEKDINLHVNNDWKQHVLHQQHVKTENNYFCEVIGETHRKHKGPRKTELLANDNLTVKADQHVAIEGSWLTKVGDEIHIKAGAKIVFEAGTEATIKVGSSFIKLDPSGIHAVASAIGLNSGGSPGSGSGASPELPDNSVSPDAGKMPKVEKLSLVQALFNAQKAAQPLCPICGAS